MIQEYINLTNLKEYIHLVETTITNWGAMLWGIPIIVFIIGVGLICTFLFRFVQFKYFFSGWKLLGAMEGKSSEDKNTISPMQAFINALSASLGNGGLAGMAVVLVMGGPGTAFWVFMLGFISMAIRFVEVYGGIVLAQEGYPGPLAYIKELPYGQFFVRFYAFVFFLYIVFAGMSMQTNSIGLSLQKSFGFCPIRIGVGFALLFLYILLGGSRRIMKASEYIIPTKVFLFFIGIIILLVYHHANIIPAFYLVMDQAFTTNAIVGGVAAYTMQRAITVGFSKALNATEVGVGTAGIFFGATESKAPLKTSIISMLTAFISTNLVCAAIIFAIVTSGVSLTSGATSTELVIIAFETVIGKFAGPAVTFLSFAFGIGVIVAYTFLGYKIWEFLFGKSTLFIYYFLVVFIGFVGPIVSVDFVWNSVDFLVGILIFINLLGLLWNMRKIKISFDNEVDRLKEVI